MKTKHAVGCLGALIAICALPAMAQAPENAGMAQFKQTVAAMCQPTIRNMMEQQAKQVPLLKSSALDAKVCQCTDERVGRDSVLRSLFAGEQATIAAKLQQNEFKSYFFIRLMGAMLGCLATEMESVADTIDLPEK